MGWDGSGNVTRDNGLNSGSNTWQQDAAEPSPNMSSARHDTHDEDLASAIENSIAKDGQNSATANLPMGGFKHLNVAEAALRSQYAAVSQIQDGAFIFCGTTGGSSNAFTASFSIAPTALVHGMCIVTIADRAPTGAATLNLNSIGAKAAKKYDGTVDIAANDWVTGNRLFWTYDSSSSGQWVLLNPRGVNLLSVLVATLTATGAVDLQSTLNVGGTLNVEGASEIDDTLNVTGATTLAAVTASGTITASGLTASRALSLNGSKAVVTNAWTAITSTPTASGSMTITGHSHIDSGYLDLGNYVPFSISVTFTLGGTTSNIISIPFPITCTAQNANTTFVCSGNENATGIPDLRWRYDGTNIVVFKAGLGNWTLGANAGIFIEGFLIK